MNLGQAWARPLETTWYVRSESSEGEIQHSLAGLLDPEDGLIVQPVSEGAAMGEHGSTMVPTPKGGCRSHGQRDRVSGRIAAADLSLRAAG